MSATTASGYTTEGDELAPRKKKETLDLQEDLAAGVAQHKPDRDEGSGIIGVQGDTIPIRESGAAESALPKGSTMPDVDTIDAEDTAADTAADGTKAPNPFGIVTAAAEMGVNPAIVEAIAAALQDAPIGTKVLSIAALPDNATYSAAASQADKYRVALRDGYRILTTASSAAVSGSKGRAQPHRWTLRKVAWKDTAVVVSSDDVHDGNDVDVQPEA